MCLDYRLAMRSIGMQLRQLRLVGQLRLDGSSESATQGIITSERSFGLNVFVLGKQRYKLFSRSQPLQKYVKKNCHYRTSSKIRNFFLELSYVTA